MGKKNARVPLLEGESENPEFCTLLGECLVHIDAHVPKGTVIKVSCNYAANGTISVTAKLSVTNAAAYVEVRRDGYSTFESLDIWTARLSTGGGDVQATEILGHLASKPSVDPLIDRQEKDKVINRLDDLYRYVGKCATAAGTPPSSKSTAELMQQLREESATLKQLIQRLEVQHQQTQGFRERSVLAGQLAQLKMAWAHSMRLLDHTLVVMGRDCVSEDLVADEARSFVDEARELQVLLEE